MEELAGFRSVCLVLKLTPWWSFSKFFDLYIPCIFTLWLSSGMGFLMYFAKLVNGIMRIQLGCGQAAVPK